MGNSLSDNKSIKVTEYKGMPWDSFFYLAKSTKKKAGQLSFLYEKDNHLGNVLVTLSDMKIAHNNGGIIDYYNADVTTAQDYYPGGMLMPGRSYFSTSYTHGFNGMLKDDDISGSGNMYTAEYWEYDSRLIRRWNMDPLQNYFAPYSPYNFALNNPMFYNDPDGLAPNPNSIPNKLNRALGHLIGRTKLFGGQKLEKAETEEEEVTLKHPKVLVNKSSHDFIPKIKDKEPKEQTFSFNEINYINYSMFDYIKRVGFKFNSLGGEHTHLSVTRPTWFGLGEKTLFDESWGTKETPLYVNNRLLVPNSLDFFGIRLNISFTIKPEYKDVNGVKTAASSWVAYKSYKVVLKMRATPKYFEAMKKAGVFE